MLKLKRTIAAMIIATGMSSASAIAAFKGTLELIPTGCQSTGICELRYDFGYVDPSGNGWQAKAGNKTDGASIPGWAQPFVGQPFAETFIKAAVIHDHYCDRHVKAWKLTHRVFLDALLESGVDPTKAKIMYAGVYLGGPRWRDTIPGIGCPVGKLCIATTNKPAPPNTLVYDSETGPKLVRQADFDETFQERFEQLKTQIESGAIDTVEEIEIEANRLQPEPLFETNLPYLGEAKQ